MCLTNLFKNADARAAKIHQNADKPCLPKLQTRFVCCRQMLSILDLALKLVTGSPRRDKQDPVEIFVIVGLSGAYQARNASQMPCIRVVFDATKVEKQLPTRTAKSDDALTKNNLVAYFRNRPVLCSRSHQRPVSHICPV